MEKRGDDALDSMKKYLKDNETDFQKEANRLTQMYYEKFMKKKIDMAIRKADSDVILLGFKLQPEVLKYISEIRQRRNFCLDQVMEYFNWQKIEKWAIKQGFNPETGDSQAIYWAWNDLTENIHKHHVIGSINQVDIL
jgi:hypothetical protein